MNTSSTLTRFLEVPELPDSKHSDYHFLLCNKLEQNLTCSGYGPPENHGANLFFKTAAVTVYIDQTLYILTDGVFLFR